MPLRMELLPDPARGPGHGLLRIAGLAPGAEGRLAIFVRRNQGTEPFLGQGGRWVTEPVTHLIGAPEREASGEAVVAVGPDLVDPIATLPPNCMVLIGVETEGAKDQGRVTVRGLMASSAAGAGAEAPRGPVVHEEPLIVVDPEPVPEPEPEPLSARPEFIPLEPLVADHTRLVDEPKRKASPGVIGLGAVLVLILLAGGWYFAGLPPFGKGLEAPQPPAESPVATPSVQPPADGPIDSREALSRYIASNPEAGAAVAKAKELAGQGRQDFAMLVYQYASRLGAVEASLALGRMYDPDTWSKDSSPMDKPDAETAAYWYEPAAQAGNAEAQRRLGKILLDLPQGGAGNRDKAKEWLGKAAAQGDAEAKTLLDKAN